MKKTIVLLILGLTMLGCKTVSIHVSGEGEDVHFYAPFSMIKTALSFSDDEVLELDDLAGVDQEIDLRALARALREDGDKMMIHIEEGDQVIHGEMKGDVFHIAIDDPEEESKVQLNLPMDLVARIADSRDGEALRTSDFLKSLRHYSGVLIQVDSPYEKVKIALR